MTVSGNTGLRVYIGWDSREPEAYEVAAASLRKHASVPVWITPLRLDHLRQQGMLRRPMDHENGRMIDVISAAPQSTEFALSRFLVPFLAQEGWALFVDTDMVFFGDVAELIAQADPRYALMCVKHAPLDKAGVKMDGQVQLAYPRKNWSSVVLWNCGHPAHRRLTLDAVNGARGLDLHHFYWLTDEQIGELPAGWNWLVNLEPRPEPLQIAHFTLGGPWLPQWRPQPNDELWLQARAAYSGNSD